MNMFQNKVATEKKDIQMHHPDLIFYRISRTLQKARAHNVTFWKSGGREALPGKDPRNLGGGADPGIFPQKF